MIPQLAGMIRFLRVLEQAFYIAGKRELACFQMSFLGPIQAETGMVISLTWVDQTFSEFVQQTGQVQFAQVSELSRSLQDFFDRKLHLGGQAAQLVEILASVFPFVSARQFEGEIEIQEQRCPLRLRLGANWYFGTLILRFDEMEFPRDPWSPIEGEALSMEFENEEQFFAQLFSQFVGLKEFEMIDTKSHAGWKVTR